MKTKTHEFVIKVIFDKPISQRDALLHARDQMSTEKYYLTSWDDCHPHTMAIKKISKIKEVT